MNKYLQECIDDNMPVVFDYDGVLFEARWYPERINMPNETQEKLYEAHKKGENLYTEPIGYMRNIVESIAGEMFVLSHIHDEIEYKVKCEQISKYFPKIPKENILWAKSVNDKIKYLEQIKDQYGRLVYIDDNHSALIQFENYFSNDCKFFHVSSLYV